MPQLKVSKAKFTAIWTVAGEENPVLRQLLQIDHAVKTFILILSSP